jgi:peptidase YpeB-like protein
VSLSMQRKALVAVAVLGACGLGAAAAVQASGDDDDRPATGPQADSAKAAALKVTGGASATVERDVEDGATWEVEVTKPDGSTVEVSLTAGYERVDVESDDED